MGRLFDKGKATLRFVPGAGLGPVTRTLAELPTRYEDDGSPRFVLFADAPSVTRSGLNVGQGLDVEDFTDAVHTAPLLAGSILDADPLVDPATITYWVEARPA